MVEFDLTQEFDSDVNVAYVDKEPDTGMQTVVINSVIGQIDKAGRKMVTARVTAENGGVFFDTHFIKRERDGQDDQGTVQWLQRMMSACRLSNINDIFHVKNVAIRADVRKSTDETGKVKLHKDNGTESSGKPFYNLYGVSALPLGASGGQATGGDGGSLFD